MSTLIRQRALQTWVLSICIIAVLLSLNFYIETVHSFLHSSLKFVWFCYLVVFISTLLFANSYHAVLPGFVVKNYAVQYRSLSWEKSHEIVIKIRCYEWKKTELTPLSELSGLKLIQIEPRSTHQKRGLCWITKWQFYWSR